jgi:hypothetical protein
MKDTLSFLYTIPCPSHPQVQFLEFSNGYFQVITFAAGTMDECHTMAARYAMNKNLHYVHISRVIDTSV